MKKIYTFILMIGLAQQPVFSQNGGFTFDFGFDFDFSNTNFNTTNFNINVNIGDSFNFGDFDLVGRNPCPGCPGENINNFTFTTNSSFDNAVANEILVNRAIEAGNTAWYTEQQELIRQHLAEIFNTPFASFNAAKEALFLHSEQGNITRNSAEPISRYSSLESHGYGVSRGYLRELKLIQIRRAEINAGNLNNPQYGYLSIDTTAIRDITDLETLDLRWNTLKTPLEENIINTHRYKYTLEKLQNLGAHFDTEVVELKNSYYNSFNFWEKINYMQFLINYEEIKRLTSAPYYYPELIQLFNKFSETDKATSEVIEAYALEHRDGGDSIFANPCTYNIQTGREFSALEISSCMEAKRIAFNNLVNNTSTEDFAIENLIAELDITDTDQKNWLFAHAAEASLMVAFLDANRVNGVATAEAMDFSREFLDVAIEVPEAKFERYKELMNLIKDDPFALLKDCIQQNGLDTSIYLDLYNLPFPQECTDRLNSSIGVGPHQPITDGNVPLANVDYYSVEITDYPDLNNDGSPDSEEEMYQAFRNNFINLGSGEMNDFQFSCNLPFNSTNTGNISWEFEPVTTQDGLDFISNDPIASILLIEADASGLGTLAADDGAVIVTHFTPNDWAIATIYTDNNGTQPFSGNRQWGWIINQNGNFEFFTRAVDVANISKLLNVWPSPANTECQQDTYYNVAEASWENMQQEIAEWINSNGGQATIIPKTAIRVDKDKIKELLTSNETISEINCN